MSTLLITSIIAIILVIFSLIISKFTTLLRETNDVQSLYSFSRFQLFLWTITIAPIFLLHWGATENMSINNQTLILLGISISTTLSSILITENPTKPNPNTTQATSNFKASTKANLHTSSNKIDKNGEIVEQTVSESLLKDILKDDKGQFSIARLQNLLFTVIFIVIYITFFFKSGMKCYIAFDDTNIYVLMGISSGSYLVGKGLGN